jgi:two-component system, chemotaxis family, protein-glutamate methylesterase/glutaminase
MGTDPGPVPAPGTGNGPVTRVLICEDSRSYAAALKQALEHDGDIEVAGTCVTAEDAIAALPSVRPQLVTMDIGLPGMNGLAAVEEIMSAFPLPVLVLSAHVGPSSDAAAAALAAGAVDAVAKDDLDLRDPAGMAGAALRHRARVLAHARVIRHPRARLAGRGAAASVTHRACVAGICASTGGPAVLARLLATLPAGYPVPVLVVQHMAAGFTEGLVRWLASTIAVPVAMAADGLRAAPGVWLAPDGAHLRLSPGGLMELDRQTVCGAHRPSGDVLFRSLATAVGSKAVAVVLTGMGSDGAAGAAEVHQRGGLAIAQDEHTSAVFGMPKVAAERGVSLVLPPDDIAAALLAIEYQPLPAAHGEPAGRAP